MSFQTHRERQKVIWNRRLALNYIVLFAALRATDAMGGTVIEDLISKN